MVVPRVFTGMLVVGIFLAVIGGVFFVKNLSLVKVMINQKDPRSSALVFDKRAIETHINSSLQVRKKGIWVKGTPINSSVKGPRKISLKKICGWKTAYGFSL